MKKHYFKNFCLMVFALFFVACGSGGSGNNVEVEKPATANPYSIDVLESGIDFSIYANPLPCNTAFALMVIDENNNTAFDNFEKYGFQYEIIETIERAIDINGNHFHLMHVVQYFSDIDNPAWKTTIYGIYNTIDKQWLIDLQQIDIDEKCQLTCKMGFVSFESENMGLSFVTHKINTIANHNEVELLNSVTDKDMVFRIMGSEINLLNFDNEPCN